MEGESDDYIGPHLTHFRGSCSGRSRFEALVPERRMKVRGWPASRPLPSQDTSARMDPLHSPKLNGAFSHVTGHDLD